MTQIPAAWYPDPEQPGMQRYWDGNQWTEHRAPLAPAAPAAQQTQPQTQTQPQEQGGGYPGGQGSQGGYAGAGQGQGAQQTTGQQLNQAGNDLAEGVASAFTRAQTWVRQRSSEPHVEPPSFLQIAAGCSDDEPKQPLDRTVEVNVGRDDIDPARRVYAEAEVPITSDGATLEKVAVRLVPNPWNPGAPGAVAVLAGQHQLGTLPPAEAAEYRDALLAATLDRRLVSATATLRATYDGSAVDVKVTLQLPSVSALGGSATSSGSDAPATQSSSASGDTGSAGFSGYPGASSIPETGSSDPGHASGPGALT